MKPIEKIAIQPWMGAAATRQVMDALAEGGEARFVGGCVRDAVLGRTVKDIDIATPLPPQEVTVLLEGKGIKVVPTGIEHGTVTAVVEHRPYEITTLRRDVETDGRHAKVAFTDDWREDAARRDFTMNAMSCRPSGELFDYHDGLRDVRAGRVRFVGEPKARIAEDVLRLLRFYRFVAHYGRGTPDDKARNACRSMAEHLGTLSPERVRDETLKLLAAPSPHDVLVLMHNDGVLAAYLSEATDIAALSQLVKIERRYGLRIRAGDALRRLAIMLRYPSYAGTVAARLRLSNKDRDRLAALRDPDDPFTFPEDERAVRRECYRLGRELFIDRAVIFWAREGVDDGVPLETLLEITDTFEDKPLPVGGADVLALGVAKGEQVGAALRALELWWIGQDFKPGRDEALARLRDTIGKGAAA